MSNYVRLITPDYMYKWTSVDSNVDSGFLNSAIDKAQKLHIRRFLGENLYNKILNDTGGGSISGKYLTLLNDYISPCLAKWAMYEAAPNISIRFSNAGLMVKSSDYGNAADVTQLVKMMDIIRSDAEYLSKEMINYICNNNGDFQEYYNNNTIGGSPDKKPYFCGIYLGKTNRRYE